MFELEVQRALWDNALLTLAEKDCDTEPELAAFLGSGSSKIGTHGLDIGCGLGRHTLAALRMGYKMTAIDFSETAVRATRQRVKTEGFEADVRCASMHALPFQDGRFDFAFSWCVLNHGPRFLFEKAITEAIRSLRFGGFLFGCVMSQNDSRFGNGRKVSADCFAFTEGPEAGVFHYFPTERDIARVLSRNSVIERIDEVFLETEENRFYHPKLSRSSYFEFVARKVNHNALRK